MKPTKEQLADPKWWGENAPDGLDYCYWDIAYQRIGFDKQICKENCYFKPLAKRPEPEWVPEVGEWCEVESDTRNVWKKAMYIGVDSIGSHVFDVEKRHLWRIDPIGCLVRPLKTQREEFIEKTLGIYNCGKSSLEMAEALYDAGCRFDLTEKDGE